MGPLIPNQYIGMIIQGKIQKYELIDDMIRLGLSVSYDSLLSNCLPHWRRLIYLISYMPMTKMYFVGTVGNTQK